MTAARQAVIERNTAETRIRVTLGVDGSGKHDIRTGIGFFDHMLAQVARHGLFDIQLEADGDLAIDGHHTVEDVGIALGSAFRTALGDCAGITRAHSAVVPMDEALVLCAIDISGRGFLAMDVQVATASIGEFSSELLPEFFRAFAHNAGWTVHVRQLAGANSHHVVEAVFKAFARAARGAASNDPRERGVPSTKGVIE